ncbi:MAG: tetratricopeptide repeat protein [Treponema sp.]|nr:tetratricopeptide repeat protein [Treponema sp.]
MRTSSKLILAATGLILSALAAYEVGSIAGLRRDLRKAMDGIGADIGTLDERRRSEVTELFLRLEAGLGRLELRSEKAARAASSSLEALSRSFEAGRAAAEARLSALQAAEGNRNVAASAAVPAAAAAAVPAATPASAAAPSAEAKAIAAVPAACAGSAPAEGDLAALSELATGRAHFSAGEFALARDRFAAALRLHSDNLTARLYSALSLFKLNPGDAGSYPLVERDLRLVLESDPGQKDALDALGLIAMERGEWREAERYFARRIGIDPAAADAVEARKRAGLCALYGGRPEDAAEYFKAVLRTLPGDAEAAALTAKALAAEDE